MRYLDKHGFPVELIKGRPITNLLRLILHTRQIQSDSKAQIDKLARFIMSEIDGEPSRSEGSVDCAIRLLRQWGPGPEERTDTPQPVREREAK